MSNQVSNWNKRNRIKDTINNLTLEVYKKHPEELWYLEYLHKDIFSVLNMYDPLIWGKIYWLRLHPMYDKYIEQIMQNNFYIYLIVKKISEYFQQNPEESFPDMTYTVTPKWLNFNMPINSVCGIHYYNWKYQFHNPDSEYIINFFIKLFDIYIKTIYDLILRVSKNEEISWEKEYKGKHLSSIIKLK